MTQKSYVKKIQMRNKINLKTILLSIIMKILLLICILTSSVNSYIYHNHISIRQPHMIKFQDKLTNDIKNIDEEEAFKLSSFWYGELKLLQNSQYDERQNIEFLYSNSNNDYFEMSNMMTFNYDFENNAESKYLVWKPRIQPQFMNDGVKNALFYPCFRQSMCLISYKLNNKHIQIENTIYSPFWKGDLNIIQKKSKSLMIEYFLGDFNYSSIAFN